MAKKQQTTVRIAFQNIGGFLQEDDRAIKLETLRRMVTERKIDILGFTEPNTCWDLVPESMRLPKFTRGWWETCQWNLTYNRTEKNSTTYQPGGTGILCVNNAAHRALRPGDDPTGLGRWCWTRIRGTQGFYLRIVSMYRPCESNGPLTTYQQQVRRLTRLNRYSNPREAILTDLSKEIQTWQELGDHVIVLTDYNDDITSAPMRRWAANLGLVEAITWLNTGEAPPTYQRGSRPIDRIFAPPQLLERAAGGFLS